MPKETNRRYGVVPWTASIRLRLALIIAISVVATAFVLTSIQFRFSKEELEGQIHNRLDHLAYSRVARFNEYISNLQEKANYMATHSQMTRLLTDNAENPGKLVPEGESPSVSWNLHTYIQDILLKQIGNNPEIQEIRVAGNDGRVWTASLGDYVGEDLSGDPIFQAAKRRFVIGMPGYKEGTFTGIVAMPIQSDKTNPNDNFPVGVLLARMDMSGLVNILGDRSGLGKAGMVIVAKEGENGELENLLLSDRNGSNGAKQLMEMTFYTQGEENKSSCGKLGCGQENCQFNPSPPPAVLKFAARMPIAKS